MYGHESGHRSVRAADGGTHRTRNTRRGYHVRGFLRTQNLKGGYVNAQLYDGNLGRARNDTDGIAHQATQPFSAFDFVANSMASTKLALMVGIWGDSTGTAWFDDVSIEEVALVNVVRRAGTPVNVDDGGGLVYTEGSDYLPIADPKMAPGGSFDDWHTPPVVALPRGSRLKAGQSVKIDYYAAQPVLRNQVAACLAEPAVLTELSKNLQSLLPIFPDGTGFFLSYDEMRQGDTCAACAAKNLTAGDLLAWNVGQTIGIVHGARPAAPLYTWSDMFDPFHNAHGNYYLVNGDLANSWKGLPPDVVVMNWNLGVDHAKSLSFFGQRGNPLHPDGLEQVFAGLRQAGITEAEIEIMIKRNPARLLGLD